MHSLTCLKPPVDFSTDRSKAAILVFDVSVWFCGDGPQNHFSYFMVL